MRWKPKGAPPVGSLLITLAAALALGCRPDPPPSHLAVEFAGCAATLFPGPVCVLDEKRNLVLWVPKPPDTEIEIRSRGRDITAQEAPIEEGMRYRLTIPRKADRIEVVAKGPGSQRAAWSLRLSDPRKPKARERDVQGEVDRRTQGTKYRKGDGTFDRIQRLELNKARAALEDLATLAPTASLPAESRYLLAYNRCLLADKEGDFRTALFEIDQAIEVAKRAGLANFSWTARQKHALLLTDLGRLREAAEAYRELAKDHPADRNPCDQGLLLNNWAWATLLARESGGTVEAKNLEEPVPLLTEAAAQSSRSQCGLVQAHLIQLNLLLAYLQANRPDLAAQALADARNANKSATLILHLWELDLAARLDLALGQPRRATEKYRLLETFAELFQLPDGQLRAALGHARALKALGDRSGALAHLAKANDLLSGQSLQVPLHEGRAAFVSQREAVASLEIDLLLAAGRVPEAFASARHAQSRVLRQLAVGERLAGLSIEDRKAWGTAIGSYQRARSEVDKAAQEEWRLLDPEVPQARSARAKKAEDGARDLDRAYLLLRAPPAQPALAPLRRGELLLAFHPLLDGEWAAFAGESGGPIAFRRFPLTAQRLEELDGLSKEILEPFRSQIQRAQRIRVLPYGALRAIDFHALPFGRNILLAAKPVTYGLDLSPTRGASQPAKHAVLQALIVADPSGNLPGAHAEAEAVTHAIKDWDSPGQVTRLTASEAEVAAVLPELEEVDIFHFSGHGRFGGLGGLDSNLLLAAKGRLTVGDVLVLGRSPRWVVLSGCDTARSEGEDRSEGIGLAQAFALAGSRAVVASVQSVDDRTAVAFFSDLYRLWGGTADPASALRRAQLTWRRKNPKADWASFRIVEP